MKLKEEEKKKLKVQIEGELYIVGDDQNIEVRTYTGKKDKKTNKDLYVTHGYFKDVEQAMKKIVDMKLVESQATNVKEMMREIKSIKQWVKDQFN